GSGHACLPARRRAEPGRARRHPGSRALGWRGRRWKAGHGIGGDLLPAPRQRELVGIPAGRQSAVRVRQGGVRRFVDAPVRRGARAAAVDRGDRARLAGARVKRLRATFARVPVAARWCFGIALLNAVIWGLIVPPFQVPDETGHFAYTQYLAE